MAPSRTVVMRRTWPQRLVVLMCVGVIGSALAAAWFVDNLYVGLASVGRVEISGEILLTDTAPGEPVNFLLIGNDSALGIDPDDPVHIGRVYDDRGTFNADSIAVLRVIPSSGQAWVVAIPRDLLVDIPGSSRQKINAALLIGGPEKLVETVSQNFNIEINHYIEIDFLGFRAVVDELNGIPVWFNNPAMDIQTGLNIPDPGCHVLDGSAALSYVRSRQYQEFIDDRWVSVGNVDFGRVERQQDFFILTLDRAIARGARNPPTLASLVEAGAQSVVLDSELTPAELADVGESFSDFDPESLDRLSLTVFDTLDLRGNSALDLIPDVNDAIFDVFRGFADLASPSDVRIDLFASGQSILDDDGGLLRSIGFDVVSQQLVVGDIEASVVIYPLGQRAEAETVARYLIPIPALAESADATGISVYLGTGHSQISWISPHAVGITRDAISAHGDIALPDLSAVDSVVPAASTTLATPTTTALPTTTTVVQADATTTTSGGIIGRPPEGQSCS